MANLESTEAAAPQVNLEPESPCYVEPFRLLDLPREMRDKIYGEMVTLPATPIGHEPSHATIRARGVKLSLEDAADTTNKRFTLGILRANHQVHEEASRMFAICNQVVSISTSCQALRYLSKLYRIKNDEDGFDQSIVNVARPEQHRVNVRGLYKHIVMDVKFFPTNYIELFFGDRDSKKRTFRYILPAADLWSLAENIGYISSASRGCEIRDAGDLYDDVFPEYSDSSPYVHEHELDISIYRPFGFIPDGEVLLRAFAANVRDISGESVKISGDAKHHGLARQAMMSSLWQGPQAAIDHASTQQEAGLVAYMNKDFYMADQIWWKAIEVITDLFDHPKARLHGEQSHWFHRVQCIGFELGLNTAAARMEIAKSTSSLRTKLYWYNQAVVAMISMHSCANVGEHPSDYIYDPPAHQMLRATRCTAELARLLDLKDFYAFYAQAVVHITADPEDIKVSEAAVTALGAIPGEGVFEWSQYTEEDPVFLWRYCAFPIQKMFNPDLNKLCPF